MQQHKQSNPGQKNNQRNPEVAVCQDGFEHNFSLLPRVRAPCALYVIAAAKVKQREDFRSYQRNMRNEHAKSLAESAAKW